MIEKCVLRKSFPILSANILGHLLYAQHCRSVAEGREAGRKIKAFDFPENII